jgi:hypothetical protein
MLPSKVYRVLLAQCQAGSPEFNLVLLASISPFIPDSVLILPSRRQREAIASHGAMFFVSVPSSLDIFQP